MANQFFQTLKKDHEEVKEILEQLEETKENAVKKREELFQKLREELVPHMKAEEKTFYQPLMEKKEAREEATLSGELRRSIAQSDLSLTEVAHKTGIAPSLLDEFLTGERTLRSDVMDRLANVLGYAWSKAK